MQTSVITRFTLGSLFFLLSSYAISCQASETMQSCNLFPAKTKSAGLVSATPQSVGINPAKLALVDQLINRDIAAGFPGAAILIIKDNKVIKQSVYGYKLKYSLSNGELLKKPVPLDCGTFFDLASNTKMYATNYALMHLVATGQLDIDRPVNFYIPEYKGCDTNGECRETRTVRDLLTHTAGYAADPQFFNPREIAKYGDGLYSQNRALTESIILERLPFARPRGGQPIYSDVDFMLLGILVEKISGERLDTYVTRKLYQPLGLHAVLYNPLEYGITKTNCAATEISGNTRGGSVSFPNIRALPISCQVHDEKAYYSMGGIAGHAGLFANLHDMGILLQVALNDGNYNGVQLWTALQTKQFTSPQTADDSYGLGWRLPGAAHSYTPFGNYASSSAYGHTGWTGTVTLIDPAHRLAIVLLTNKKHSQFKNGKFSGDDFATGQYHQIIDLIYQSLE